MHLRRRIGILAILGVLLHAGALVRHNAVMVGALLSHQALVADLHQICNPGGGTIDAASLPDVPRPTDAQNGCPICSGLASAFALAAPDAMPLPAGGVVRAAHPWVAVAALAGPARVFLPPVRGPPIVA
jgi:hypothetical protein